MCKDYFQNFQLVEFIINIKSLILVIQNGVVTLCFHETKSFLKEFRNF